MSTRTSHALAFALAALLFGCGEASTDSAVGAGTVVNSAEAGPPMATPPTTDASRADAGPPPVREEPPYGVLDRAGRPLVSQLLASAQGRDLLNTTPWFVAASDKAADAGQGATIGADFQSRLVSLDLLDGVDDWNGGSPASGPDPDSGLYTHPLADAWLTDVLAVDPDKPFSPAGYLDLERNAPDNATCGGRWFADDALDKTVSYLVHAEVTGVSDGVSAATKAPTMTFPYLAPPN